MNRHSLGLVASGAVVALALACAKDPTEALRTADPAHLSLSNKYITVNVGDSSRVSAIAVDGQGNQLADAITFTALGPQVAASSAPASTPLRQTNAFIKAVQFGGGKVEVAIGSLKDTITVNTLPASARITGQTDTLLGSGATMTLTAQGLSASGGVVSGVTPITWTSSNTSVATVSSTGVVSGRAPGVVDITATLPGGTAKVSFVVVPGVFVGTLSATSAPQGDVITLTAAAGTSFDSDTRVFFGGNEAFVEELTATQLKVAVPTVGTASAVELLITGMGSAQLAQKTTFTNTTGTIEDRWAPDNYDPSTAPNFATIRDANNNIYFTQQGTSYPYGGSDELDVFAITNSGGSDADVTVSLSWFPEAVDSDIYLCDDQLDVCLGDSAGSDNPEEFEATIPAGETWYLWVLMYDSAGRPFTEMQIHVDGLP